MDEFKVHLKAANLFIFEEIFWKKKTKKIRLIYAKIESPNDSCGESTFFREQTLDVVHLLYDPSRKGFTLPATGTDLLLG